MTIVKRMAEIFDGMVRPDRWQLWAGIERCGLTAEGIEPFLAAPSIYPYGRQQIYRSEHVEILVMNWAENRECAPHDHGQSWGWVVIFEGIATHSVYKIADGASPALHRTTREVAGR